MTNDEQKNVMWYQIEKKIVKYKVDLNMSTYPCCIYLYSSQMDTWLINRKGRFWLLWWTIFSDQFIILLPPNSIIIIHHNLNKFTFYDLRVADKRSTARNEQGFTSNFSFLLLPCNQLNWTIEILVIELPLEKRMPIRDAWLAECRPWRLTREKVNLIRLFI